CAHVRLPRPRAIGRDPDAELEECNAQDGVGGEGREQHRLAATRAREGEENEEDRRQRERRRAEARIPKQLERAETGVDERESHGSPPPSACSSPAWPTSSSRRSASAATSARSTSPASRTSSVR